MCVLCCSFPPSVILIQNPRLTFRNLVVFRVEQLKTTSPREGFIVNMEQQQEVMRRQDEAMDLMADSMGNIRDMSHHIANELDEQAV